MKTYKVKLDEIIDARLTVAAANIGTDRAAFLQMAITLLCTAVEKDASIVLKYNDTEQNILYK